MMDVFLCLSLVPILQRGDRHQRGVSLIDFSRNMQLTGWGAQEDGKWPDKAAECVFREDHALRMYQREGVNWLVFNWYACLFQLSSRSAPYRGRLLLQSSVGPSRAADFAPNNQSREGIRS